MGHRDEIVALERKFWEAAGDADFYRRHFAENGRCVFAMAILDKAQTVGSMNGVGGWRDVTMESLTATAISDGVVALTYEATAGQPDGTRYEANVSSVYVRRDGEWQLVIHQQTPRTP